jgi:hypothetical protein
MNTRHLITAAGSLGLGLLLSATAYLASSAQAGPFDEESDDAVEQVATTASYDEAAPYPGRLRCKAFPHPLDGTEFELPGTSSDAGLWVQGYAVSWQIYTTELVVGQKSTGFPQGWLHVCLRPL